MTLPDTSLVTLWVAILGLICLGSWANFFKLTRKWRFELFYMDFAAGAAAAALVAAFTFGSLGYDSFTFTDDLMRAGKRSMAYAAAAGVVFNLGNMLLVGAISLLGMSLAFPIAMGVGIALATVIAYLVSPQGNPVFVLSGAAAMVLASLVAIMAYRSLVMARELEKMKAGEHRTLRPTVSWRGVIVALVGGLILGSYEPLLTAARGAETGLGPYSIGVLFAGGVFFSAFVYNLYFMNLPLKGEALRFTDYFRGTRSQHLWGFLGGVVWVAGAIAGFVVNAAPEEARLGPPAGYVLANGGVALASLWGAVAWRELKPTDPKVISLIALALFLLLAGMFVIGSAPLYLNA